MENADRMFISLFSVLIYVGTPPETLTDNIIIYLTVLSIWILWVFLATDDIQKLGKEIREWLS